MRTRTQFTALAILALAACGDSISEPQVSTDPEVGPFLDGHLPEGFALAYLANQSSGQVAVVDVASRSMIGQPISLRGANAIAITPDGTRAYVSQSIGRVSMIDVATTRLIGDPIVIESGSRDLAITPDGNRLYVTGSVVSVIEIVTNTVVATIAVHASAIAITPDGRRAYVTTSGNRVQAIDLVTNALLGEAIPLGPTGGVGATPGGIEIAPDGLHAYATDSRNDAVYVIDVATNAVVGTPIPVGNAPSGITITPDGRLAYVANPLDRSVSVIDLATHITIAPSIPVGVFPQKIAITPDRSEAWVTLANNDETGGVAAIDIATQTVVGSKISVGSTGPRGIAFVTVDEVVPPGSDPCTVDVTLTTQADVDQFDCTEVGGRLTIGPSVDITNVDALAGLTVIRGALLIDENVALTNVDGLSDLNATFDLVIAGNPALTNVNGLSSVVVVGDVIIISGNDALQHLDGLSSLVSANQAEIHHNASLARVALPALTSIGWLFLEANPALVETGFPSLSSLGNLDLFDNDALTRLDGFAALTDVGLLQIGRNDLLPHLDGLSNLRTGGLISISENAGLKNVDGLSGLTEVDASMLIQDNPVLENVDGLSPLRSADEVFITGNASLSKCACGLYEFLTDPGQTVFVVENNAPGCNSVGDITAAACAECAGMTLSEDLTRFSASGALDAKDGRWLANRLRIVLAQADKGHIAQALRHLDAFVARVEALAAEASIDPEAAASLLSGTQTLRRALAAQEN